MTPHEIRAGISRLFREIEAECSQEAEFGCALPSDSHRVDGDEMDGQRVLYTTKRHCVRSLLPEVREWPEFVVISLFGGLPDEQHVPWIAAMCAGKQVGFLGDGDPVDLLIYAWIRTVVDVQYLGVNDELLAALGTPIDQRNSIALSLAEMAGLSQVAKLVPDCEALWGTRCAALLRGGYKLELEGAIHGAGMERGLILNAICGLW